MFAALPASVNCLDLLRCITCRVTLALAFGIPLCVQPLEQSLALVQRVNAFFKVGSGYAALTRTHAGLQALAAATRAGFTGNSRWLLSVVVWSGASRRVPTYGLKQHRLLVYALEPPAGPGPAGQISACPCCSTTIIMA